MCHLGRVHNSRKRKDVFSRHAKRRAVPSDAASLAGDGARGSNSTCRELARRAGLFTCNGQDAKTFYKFVCLLLVNATMPEAVAHCHVTTNPYHIC